MRWISGRSITGPSLRFNVDGTDIDVFRSPKINTSAKRENAESISVGMGIGARLVLKTTYAAKSLHISVETALTDKRVPRSDEVRILSNVRWRKEADVMHVGLHTEATPQIDIAVDREALNVSGTVIGYGKREACANLHGRQPRSRWNGLSVGRYRKTEHKN